jgi:hypothetical protein
MKTTPTPFSTIPALTDEGVLATALDCLQSHLSIDMQGVCSFETLFTVLLRAASRADSIELETQLNAALQHRLPPKVLNPRHRLAIDLHLLSYYGHPSVKEAPYIYRSQAKAGTTSFFAYTGSKTLER